MTKLAETENWENKWQEAPFVCRRKYDHAKVRKSVSPLGPLESYIACGLRKHKDGGLLNRKARLFSLWVPQKVAADAHVQCVSKEAVIYAKQVEDSKGERKKEKETQGIHFIKY